MTKHHGQAPSGGRRLAIGLGALAAAAGMLIGLSGCGGDSTDPVSLAQANVESKEKALADAQDQAEKATEAFCDASSAYVTAIDRYGDILTQTAPTVGDVKDAGQDLADPRDDVTKAADEVTATRDQVAIAEQELADAKAQLAQAQGSEPEASPTPSGTNEDLSESPAVSRVKQAEADFEAAQEGITDQTPLREASVQFNSAAVALEISWLALISDAGCLTDPQQEQAADAVQEYTTALQQSLADAGYFEGEVDGVYGPDTVDAVQALQKAHDLPQTGAVDKATNAALQSDLAAEGMSTTQEETASTAALQQTLTLAGYWDGPVDGQWSSELTDALEELQGDLGVPVTGTVDAATIAAFEQALAQLTATPSPSPTSSRPEDLASPEASPTQ